MPEPTASENRTVAEVQRRLDDVAKTLRESSQLEAETRAALAQLVQELSTALARAEVPPAEVAHLAASTARLAELLHHPPDTGVMAGARASLEAAIAQAESHAPFAVGLARQFLTALANIGI